MDDDPREKFAKYGLDTLRLSDKQMATALAQIEARIPIYNGGERRRDIRCRYKKVLRVIIRVAHPGGSDMTFAVRTRDLSAKGLGFLHGSFLYTGTRCSIVLPTLDGRMISVLGTVRRCQLLSGKLHEVGVEFGEEIDVALFLDDVKPAECKPEPKPVGESIFRKRRPPGQPVR